MTLDKQYSALLADVLYNGVDKSDRTGTGTKSVFHRTIRVNLADGFPLLTTKRVHFKSVAYELLWLLSGSDNIKFLTDNGVRIWNEWSNEEGSLGRTYGVQWRDFNGKTDQIADVVESIKNNPDSRRHLVSAWNPAEISMTALPPCHYSFQFQVLNGKLNCIFNMRSTDVFLGLPFNIASYALLTHMMAHVTGLEPGELVYSGADVHIYSNHIEQVKEQLSREERELPTLKFARTVDNIFDFKFEDFVIEGYNPHPTIRADVAV